mgnify:CR=1 FL=1
MHNSQNTAKRIKSLAKTKGVSVSKLLTACDLNKNALYTMQTSGYLPRLEAIAKIADYLNCSIDYLVGRTDVPEVNGREFKEKKIDDLIERLIKDGELTEDESVKVIDALK